MVPKTLKGISNNICQSDGEEQFFSLLVCHIWPKTYSGNTLHIKI